MVRLLLEYEGIDTCIKREGQEDALDIAKDQGHDEIAEMIEAKRIEQAEQAKLAEQQRQVVLGKWTSKKSSKGYNIHFSF